MRHIPFWFIFIIINIKCHNHDILLALNTIFLLYWMLQGYQFSYYYNTIIRDFKNTIWMKYHDAKMELLFDADKEQKRIDLDRLFLDEAKNNLPDDIYNYFKNEWIYDTDDKFKKFIRNWWTTLPYIIIIISIFTQL